MTATKSVKNPGIATRVKTHEAERPQKALPIRRVFLRGFEIALIRAQ